MDINEIKKDLYKSKNMAKFSHYQSGNLFYTVELVDGKYQFPISVIDKFINGFDNKGKEVFSICLSEDLGITPFGSEVRGSELIRWIQKAMNKFEGSEFIKVG